MSFFADLSLSLAHSTFFLCYAVCILFVSVTQRTLRSRLFYRRNANILTCCFWSKVCLSYNSALSKRFHVDRIAAGWFSSHLSGRSQTLVCAIILVCCRASYCEQSFTRVSHRTREFRGLRWERRIHSANNTRLCRRQAAVYKFTTARHPQCRCNLTRRRHAAAAQRRCDGD